MMIFSDLGGWERISLRMPGLCLSMVVLGCGPSANATGTRSTPAASTLASTAPSLPPTSASASPYACAEYAAAVCTQIGETAPECGTITKVMTWMTPDTCAFATRDLRLTVAKLRELRQPCDEIVEKLCQDLGRDTDTCKIVRTHTAAFPPERCASMSERYPEVHAELQRMEESNRPLSAELVAKLVSTDAPSFGPANAPVTLIAFADLQCPFSAKFSALLPELKAKYPGRLRLVFRQFPLSFHNHAESAAIAALAAHAQGKFWEYQNLAFTHQTALEEDSLIGYAEQLKLDRHAFAKALKDPALKARVDADVALGKLAGVQGTPAVYVNGKKANPAAIQSLSDAIDLAMKK